ncbi:16S rRNA (cytosine(1402)-N(4))-methyltransferase RsmH [Oscillatoria sp. CS-180]|uniref:16S rRNA (cytosine(1402)-N(4))-methyltransferase RsmH n=1 Tax=Oscillatoria sp. CS-180 TaxID=3021720 RepID=UPI00232D107F|nr:16S rRNA (cytosine(1402)-N(4))-methyltransferase RsmH [Oscillatoria sp. CS-180]MDB9528232.1 16S rRNA (cytosine(1402)-N(4))-methyltransferase RsmH [Oscillatoria sp. CS-180]
MLSSYHVPVMPQAVVEGLNLPTSADTPVVLDATVGGGGHSELILQACEALKLVALDQDEVALAAAQQRLTRYGDRVTFHHTNFASFQPNHAFQGILADIGVSSAQLDTPERGFSFRKEAPLDMRMNQQQNLSAADVVNHWNETELANTIFTYGEERLSRRIARAIVEQRPFQTTTQLADAIARCVPKKYRYGRIHPATRTFQALRIAVNAELDVLKSFLSQAPSWLVTGGRLVVISFHSLEDRIVKQAFRGDERLKIITKKPLVATEDEVQHNPRARSAKLRVAERIELDE